MGKQKDPTTGRSVYGAAHPNGCVVAPAVQIRLLGDFRLPRAGQAVSVPCAEKTKILLFHLTFRHTHRVPRDTLIDLLWPHADPVLANKSFNSIVYPLRKLLGTASAGAAPVSRENGFDRLNTEAGVRVDFALAVMQRWSVF